MTNLPERAARVAARAHAVQIRSGGEPYVCHCARVAKAVSLLCDDPEVIAAAWLHDVIEDCDVTAEQLLIQFGSRVAKIVVELTDVFTPREGLNRAERKGLEAVRLAECSWEARLIKVCDVMDNARDIEAKGGEFAKVWRAEKAMLVRGLMGDDISPWLANMDRRTEGWENGTETQREFRSVVERTKAPQPGILPLTPVACSCGWSGLGDDAWTEEGPQCPDCGDPLTKCELCGQTAKVRPNGNRGESVCRHCEIDDA